MPRQQTEKSFRGGVEELRPRRRPPRSTPRTPRAARRRSFPAQPRRSPSCGRPPAGRRIEHIAVAEHRNRHGLLDAARYTPSLAAGPSGRVRPADEKMTGVGPGRLETLRHGDRGLGPVLPAGAKLDDHGDATARRIRATITSAISGAFQTAAPQLRRQMAPVAHPKLTSTPKKPSAAIRRGASAIRSGSDPRI